MDFSFITRFAVTYDCNAYGASTYNNDEPCVTTTDNTPATGSDGRATATTTVGGLSATGTNVAFGIGLGVVLIVISLAIFIKMRRSNKKSSRS